MKGHPIAITKTFKITTFNTIKRHYIKNIFNITKFPKFIVDNNHLLNTSF
jgi:hypothetical protein